MVGHNTIILNYIQSRKQSALRIKRYNEFKKNLKPQKLLNGNEKNDICWIVTCHNELDYVKQCVESLKKNDTGKIIIINDGGKEDGLKELAERYCAKYINSENYKKPETGYKWWERFFKIGLESGSEFIVKIDPDAYFCKPLEYSLKGLNFFGCIKDTKSRSKYSVQGGIQGFSSSLIKCILDSNVLILNCWGGIKDNKYFSTDKFLTEMFRNMIVFGEEWNEVMSVWSGRQQLILEKNHKYSIIHPVNLLNSGNNLFISNDHINRLNICKECHFFDATGRNCLYNDCYIYPLTKLENEKCPLGKW